jgi:hypothetical protein
MQHYYVNEAAFALPAWPLVDRTLHRLAAPLEGAEDPLTVEIRRVPMEPGKSLRQLVDEAVEAEKANDNGYAVVETSEASLDGAPALLLRARLRARDSVYLKLQAHVALGDVWIAFVVTGPSTHRATCEETFDRLVHGLRWRRG